MKLLLIFFIFIFCCCKGDITQDLERVLDSYNVEDPACIFNHTEVNSKTIQFFPKCETVFGILVINENTDVSVSQLTKAFKNMIWLAGGMRIENSNFTNFSFLPKSDEHGNFYIACEKYGVFIENNKKLNDSFTILNLYLAPDDDNNECNFFIKNNPKLEVLCDEGCLGIYLNMQVSGNKADCGCHGGEITTSSLSQYKLCETLLGGLKLSNITDSTKLSDLSNIRIIKGVIDIHHTNLRNLSFLENIETLKISNKDTMEKVFVNIHDNPEMTSLGWPILEIENVYDGIRVVNLENLHPDFCITVEEMKFFLDFSVTFLNLQAKYCQEGRKRIYGLNVCRFETMSKLSSDCEMILGDVIIESGDEDHFSKLEKVLYLFGSLTIQNTDLENLKSLRVLHYIASLNDSRPVIQLTSNKYLKNVTLPNLVNIITGGNRTAIIQDNHSYLFKSSPCRVVTVPGLDETVEYFIQYRINLTFYGGTCGTKVKLPSNGKVGSIAVTIPILLTLLFFTMTNLIWKS